MTARQVFEATLIELSKVQAPALKLYEFNYLFNKAINLYINKVYNTYDLNQQTTDDLRVLKATAYLTPKKWNESNSALHNCDSANASSYLSVAHRSIQSLHGATYEVAMPIDYLHLLNCVCIYYVAKQKDCWDAGSYIEVPATRLTADSWSLIVTDIYNRPSPMRPYYYIHNQNNSTNNAVLPTDPITSVTGGMPNGTDLGGPYLVTSNGLAYSPSSDCVDTGVVVSTDATSTTSAEYIAAQITYLQAKQTYLAAIEAADGDADAIAAAEATWNAAEATWRTVQAGATVETAVGGVAGSNFPRTFTLDYDNDGTPETVVSLVEKPIGLRAGNTSNVRMEIRYGKDDTLFQLKEVQVDYVKSPQFIRLTQEQIDLTEDTSQIMEFPDYVNQEIINELVHLVMEHSNDPRLSNNIQMTQSIARPTGQLQQPALAQQRG